MHSKILFQADVRPQTLARSLALGGNQEDGGAGKRAPDMISFYSATESENSFNSAIRYIFKVKTKKEKIVIMQENERPL